VSSVDQGTTLYTDNDRHCTSSHRISACLYRQACVHQLSESERLFPLTSARTAPTKIFIFYWQFPIAQINSQTNKHIYKLECGPMPNVMAAPALPNIGGAAIQRRKVWLTPTTRVPRSNAAKTRNRLKLAGVPQTRQQISGVSGPKFTIL